MHVTYILVNLIALTVLVSLLPSQEECLPCTHEFVYLSLKYALKCDGRANLRPGVAQASIKIHILTVTFHVVTYRGGRQQDFDVRVV